MLTTPFSSTLVSCKMHIVDLKTSSFGLEICARDPHVNFITLTQGQARFLHISRSCKFGGTCETGQPAICTKSAAAKNGRKGQTPRGGLELFVEADNPGAHTFPNISQVPCDKTSVQLDLPLPLSCANIMIEFSDFHPDPARGDEAGATGSGGRRGHGTGGALHCPRCGRPVTDMHGVCRQCGEVAFQCCQVLLKNWRLVCDVVLCCVIGAQRGANVAASRSIVSK